MSEVLTTKEAAAYLRIGRGKLYRLVRRGDIAYIDVGGEFRYATEDLNDWLRRSRVPSKAEREAARFTRRRDPVGERPSPERVTEFWGVR